MKKFIYTFALILSVMAVAAGCGKSEIKASESGVAAENAAVAGANTNMKGTMEFKKETKAYTIPADAPTGENGGPGMMKTEAAENYENYPDDKKPVAYEAAFVSYYYVDAEGVKSDFEAIEACDAQGLLALLSERKAISEDTKLVSFENDGAKGILKINKLEGGYSKAKEKEVVACIVNTFIDNFGVQSIELTAGDKEYGELGYMSEHDIY